MNVDTPCLRLLSDVANPMEKIKALLAMVPAMDDTAMPRQHLVTILYIVADYVEELEEAMDLATRERGAE
jgi:hypothetical protein